MSISQNWQLEVSGIFKAVDLTSSGLVEMNENTYDFDPKEPKDSWLYPAFIGLKKLRDQGFKADSFATIGTGAGIDSIGVYELFHPKQIYQIDIHPNIVDVADRNVKQVIGVGATIQTFLGDLCQPLVERAIKVDLVYANIPNIPSVEPVFDKKVAASQFASRKTEDCPELFQKWYLTLQYLFLKQAKLVLNPGGVSVNAVGIRVPYEIVEQLYASLGYMTVELASVYKIQSEPEDTLLGYAQQEAAMGVGFDFYDHELAWPFWQKELESQNLTSPQIKKALEQFRISATQAWQAFKKDGKQAGHIAAIFKSTL